METDKITVKGGLFEKIETTKYGNVTVSISISSEVDFTKSLDIQSEEFVREGKIAGDVIQDIVEEVFGPARERIIEAFELGNK